MSSANHVLTMGSSSSASLRSQHHARPRAGLLSLFQLLLAGAFHLTVAYAHPVNGFEEDEPKSPSDPGLWIYLGTAIALVLIGGAFAGLTIALMGQDEVYLQVISESGEGAEKKNATKVLNLLKKGKHWVLVTLLVGNVITNETLPLVLDRSIGGGYAAAISSTVLVIVFGEIVPQSICVRFGLPIGAWMAPVVLLLMWIFAPISWPIAKLLDYLLGEDHGTTYKKAGLKTLVTLHKTMGTAPGERLNEDEVSIISGVLDLKAKPVGSIMTPMNDVFTLSAEAVLDEVLIDKIMHEGYSRIPVYDPSNKSDFVGMLLVKMLITYDPEDCYKVTDFALATLPETRPDTSCLDIINFFQQGKSHMVLVSDYPGEPFGALGVVTLEDVIEELIGEEIIDESDVFIDVHKAIRRMQPAPTHLHRGRVPKGEVIMDNVNSQADGEENLIDVDGEVKENGEPDRTSSPAQKRLSAVSMDYARSPLQKAHTFLMRRANSTGSGSDITSVQIHPYTSEMKEQLRNIGPSNLASRPKQSRINTVKVKPGVGTIPEHRPAPLTDQTKANIPRSSTSAEPQGFAAQVVSPGLSAKDGVQAMHAGAGLLDRSNSTLSKRDRSQGSTRNRGIQADRGADVSAPVAEKVGHERRISHSTLGSMYSSDEDAPRHRKGHGKQKKLATARSGSITENFIESGGVKKLVLEMTSSSEDAEEVQANSKGQQSSSQPASRTASQRRGESGADRDGALEKHDEDGEKKKKKRRRPRKKKGGEKDGTYDENTPLIRH